MSTDDTRILGYGGSGVIDGVQVLVTSASLSTEYTRPSTSMLSITSPPDMSTRTRVLQADGVASYTGQIAFDVTAISMALFTTSTLIQRRYPFRLAYSDGNTGWTLQNCYYSSLTLSGSAGGLISCSLSVASNIAPTDFYPVPDAFIRSEVPYGYWWSGNLMVRDWEFTINQEVSPVYGNHNGQMEPKYLRIGTWNMTLGVTTYNYGSAYEPSDITVATKNFSLTGMTASLGYNFGGQTELGTYTHSFQTSSLTADSSSPVIVVTAVP